jgi:uncharacterized protein
MQGKNVKRKVLSLTVASSMVLGLLAPGMPQEVSAEDVTFQDLIISEYIEGGSYNKAIELYNGTGAPIDLSNYSLELHSNGETSGKILELDGILNAGEVYVVAHDSAVEDILDQADITDSYVINFNGDDPITLRKNDSVIDSVGQAGVKVNFGADVTLTRKSSIISGDPDVTNSFDSSVEWDSHAKDTFSNLGSHLSSDPAPEPEPVELSTILEARSAAKGIVVKVEGIVTASFIAGNQTNLFIQDDTADVIIRGSDLTAQPGDELVAEGKLNDYYVIQQIEVSASNVEITTEGKGIPGPEELVSTDLSAENGEQHEGEFVEFTDATIESKDENGNFTAKDEAGAFLIKPNEASLLEIGKTYEILRGVIDYNYNEYKLVPRSSSDVILES